MEFLRTALEQLDPKLVKRSKLVEVDGTPLLDSTVANLELLRNFKALPDDLLICTYPKSGKRGRDMKEHDGKFGGKGDTKLKLNKEQELNL